MSAVRIVPYRGYIELLLLANAPVEQVRQAFTRRSLPEPTPDLLAAYRRELWDKLTIETRNFYASKAEMFDMRSLPEDVATNLRAAGFAEAFDKAANLTEARRWFDSPDLRACFFAHVMGGRDDADILDAMSSLLKVPANPDTMQAFKKFFCDPLRMTPMDWREWVFELRSFIQAEAEIYSMCFSNRVPFSFVKWKVNASIGKYDLDAMIQHTAGYSYMKGLELAEGSPDENYETVQSWLGQFMRAYSLHKTIGSGKSEGEGDRVQDALFRLTQVREKPRSVTDLENVTRTAPARSVTTGPTKPSGDSD